MNSKEIFAVIEQVAATPGKNDKIALVTQHIDDPDFHRALVYAYDPFKTYGVRKVPTVEYAGKHAFSDETWHLLDRLASRELSGNAALDEIRYELGLLDQHSGELLRRIILKDMRAGFSESTVNKAKKGSIPTFPYMRCSLPKDTDFSKWDWDKGVLSQEKADGMFTNVSIDPAGAFMTTRQGTPLPSRGFEALLGELTARFESGQQLHGEILVMQGDKVLAREIGNGMLNKVMQGGNWEEGCMPILKVWDAIPLSCVVTKGRCDTPYSARLANIHRQLKNTAGVCVSIIETRLVKSLKEAYAHCKELMLQGKEGTILKKPTMIWRDHTSKDQIKLKLEAHCELEVVGFLEGYGKNAATFGSLLCRSKCGLIEVAVGTGLTDAMRLEIHNNRDAWLGSIITVKSNAIMYSENTEKKPHSLFLPVFIEQRLDKSEADDLAKIEWQFENAIDLVGEAA